jgi:hypothetical protein
MSEAEHAAQPDEEPAQASAQRDAQDEASPGAPSPARTGGRLSPRAALDLQRTAGNRSVARLARALTDPAAVRDRLGHGQPLDPDVERRLSRAFDEDFSSVRVHDSSTDHQVVEDLGAHAVAVGDDIAFARGKYAPGTAMGDALIAHELAHVSQQRGAVIQRAIDDSSESIAAERDADEAVLEVAAGRQVRRRLRTGLALRRCTAPDPTLTQTNDAAKTDAGTTSTGASASANATATPVANTPVDPLHPAWVDVIPWADDTEKVTSNYDMATGAPSVTYSDRSASELADKLKLEGKPVPKPPKANAGGPPPASPPPAPTPEQKAADAAAATKRQAAIDAACTAIDTARGRLPGWAFPQRLPMVDRYGGKFIGPQGFVAETDVAGPSPIPPQKKGDKPTPVDPTGQQQAAMDSAKEYKKFLRGLGTELADLTPPAPPAADATAEQLAAYKDAQAKWWAKLYSRLFYEVSAKEGGTDSINIWDPQILTWGGGIGSTSGQSSTAMFALASNGTVIDGRSIGGEVTKALHAAGIAFATTNAAGRKDWAVVDTSKKAIYRDDDAAYLIKADPRLLMLLSHISRGELPGLAPAASVISESAPASPSVSPKLQDAIRRAAYDVQEQYFLHKYAQSPFATQIKTLWEKGWPLQAIHVVLHLQWWGVGKTTLENFDRWDKFPGLTTVARSLITTHPVLVKRNGAIGKAILLQGEYADHMIHYFLDKADEVWEAPTDPVKAEDTAEGEIYAEIGFKKKQFRKLKGTPAATPGSAAPNASANAPAVARMSRELARAVLSRDQAGDAVTTQLKPALGPAVIAQPIKDWAEGQSDWEQLVAARERVEAAQIGDAVRLAGDSDLVVVVSADARDAVRREIRHRLMEIICLVWFSYGNEVADAHKGADPVNALVAIQDKLRVKLEPIHKALRDGKPQEERFEYPGTTDRDQAIRDAAIAVAQLIALSGAEGARSDPTKAHDDAKAAVPGLGEADWCGAFAFMEHQKGGLVLPSAIIGTNPLIWTGPEKQGIGIDEFCQYRPALEIKVGDTWRNLSDYHRERGSERKFQVLPAGGADFDADTQTWEGGRTRGGQIGSLDALDVQPGDLVMIDRAKGTFGDHIAMCRAYDQATHKLWTIGGNEGQPHPVNVSRAWELDKNPAPSKVDADGKPSRVYAIARLSLVDYEPHTYRKAGAAAKAEKAAAAAH